VNPSVVGDERSVPTRGPRRPQDGVPGAPQPVLRSVVFHDWPRDADLSGALLMLAYRGPPN
jgi:hypothetical protein